MDDPPDEQEARQEDAHHKDVHVEVVGQINHPEQPAPWHPLNAIFTPGERRLQREEEDHLGQRQGDHREIDTLPADRQGTHHKGEHSGTQRAENHRQFGIPAPDLGRMGGGIAGRAQEHGVPERQKATKAQEQVEGAGKQGEAHHLHQKDRVHPDRGDGKDHDHDGKGHPQGLVRGGGQRGSCGVRHGFTSGYRTGRRA